MYFAVAGDQPTWNRQFYGTEDTDTAFSSVRLEVLATVRTGVSARPLRFLDLADVDIPSLVDLAGRT